MANPELFIASVDGFEAAPASCSLLGAVGHLAAAWRCPLTALHTEQDERESALGLWFVYGPEGQYVGHIEAKSS